MAPRKKFGKKIKEEVYAKYDGKCYLCGNDITIETMHIDHKIPLYPHGTNDIDNLMPCDFACNNYKNGWSIEEYRSALKKLVNIMPNYLFKSKTKMTVAVQMGCLELKPWDGIFFFEKYKKEKTIKINGEILNMDSPLLPWNFKK